MTGLDLSVGYQVQLGEGIMVSNLLLDYNSLNITPPAPFNLDGLLSILQNLLLRRGIDRGMRFAGVRAALKAKQIVRTICGKVRVEFRWMRIWERICPTIRNKQ
jgi:hypothetical protein